MSDIVLGLIVLVVMAIGLFGTLFPVIPGLLLIWGAALVYGFVVGFTTGGVVILAILTVLLLISWVTTLSIPRKSASEVGVSMTSQLAGLGGGVVGFFVIPVIGLFVGALAGVLVAEFLRLGDTQQAWAATKGVARGFGISVLVDFGIGVVMIGLWLVWALAL